MPPADVGFLLLGPLEAHVGGRAVALTGRQRQLLVILLLAANRVVSVDRLADGLWGEAQPASPAPRIRALVAEIRRATGNAEFILTRSPGYLLPVRPGQTDIDDFDRLAGRGAEAARDGDLDAAAELYGRALALWRGQPLADVPDAHAHEVAALAERRWSALEEQADVLLTLGRHERVTAELASAVAEDPLRERFRAQLMRGLFLGGRKAAALRVYRDYEERLAEELGAEPSRELQRLRARVQADEPDLDLGRGHGRGEAAQPRPASVPRHLPRDIGRLIGRDAELAWLDGLRDDGVGVLVGPAGVGKTALAVHWAHRVAPLFPDGQLFVDMRGFAPGPTMSAGEALVRMLRALGVTARSVPSDLDDQVALYRSLLAGRRVLILLDNVAEAAHVRPLIPGERGCLLLVSSRHRLGGLVALDGARRRSVEPLGRAAAVELIAQRAGAPHLTTERAALTELAGMVGDLPLALCVAGAQLSERPQRGVADYLADLARHDLLERLRLPDDEGTFVRATLELSYATLPPEARRVYRLLGRVPGPDVSVAAAAALAALAPADAEKALETVAQVHLATESGDRRFSLHDLLREFAARLSEETDTPAAREAAFRALLDHYLMAMMAAAGTTGYSLLFVPERSAAERRHPGPFPDAAAAAAWVEAEWDNVTAAITRAAGSGPHDLAWQLVAVSHPFLVHRSVSESLRVAELGLDAARRAGSEIGEAVTLNILGQLNWRAGKPDVGAGHARRATALARSAGSPRIEARSLLSQGVLASARGRKRQAMRHYQQALVVFGHAEDPKAEIACRSSLATLHIALGRLDTAGEMLSSLLPLLAADGDGVVLSYALLNQAVVRREQGRLDEALLLLDRAHAAARATTRGGSARFAEATVDEMLGRVHTSGGRYREAIGVFERALRGARHEEHDNCQLYALNGMSTAELRLGELDSAEAHLAEAFAIAERTSYVPGRYEALLRLADAARLRGDHQRAVDRASELLAAPKDSVGTLLPRAHHLLAAVLLDRGDFDGCVSHCERGLVICRRTGQHLVRGRLLLVLGHARRRQANERGARASWRAARAVLAEMPVPERAEVAALLG
ncbi:AfsR/SARP family transcriptional regulator [Streptomyces mayteni]